MQDITSRRLAGLAERATHPRQHRDQQQGNRRRAGHRGRRAATRALIALGACAAAALTLTSAEPVQACGALFCSAAQPVNQAAERIIFAFDKEAEEVTAIVEVMYEGPSERFAWVLPVPGVPTIGVSSSQLLDRLQQLTNPVYNVQLDFSNSCDADLGSESAVSGSPPVPSFGDDDDDDEDVAVAILSSGRAGPYDYEVIQVNPALPDRATVALDWLTANQYDVTALGPEVLRPYLDANMNLLAFRLTKDSPSGSIRPVRLTYSSAAPMIPIRPTAVAANNDMGVLVWVLSSGRAVPTSYKDLELNELLIDWFNPQTTYNDVVIAAADEAQGHGFVTEQAAASAQVSGAMSADQFSITSFRRGANNMLNHELIVGAIQRFSFVAPRVSGGTVQRSRVPWDGLTDVLSQHITFPAGVTVDDFMARPQCYLAASRAGRESEFYCAGQIAPTGAELIDVSTLDRAALLSSMEELIMGPVESTAALFLEHNYLTRLYTTLSADEMTIDPVFDINAELPDVSNSHSVTLVYEGEDPESCFDLDGSWTASIDGFRIRGEGGTWPLAIADQTLPAVVRSRTQATSGPGTIAVDNTEVIVAGLKRRFDDLEQNPEPPQSGIPVLPGAESTEGGEAETGASGGGCSLASGSRSASGSFAILLGLALVRRRRRN